MNKFTPQWLLGKKKYLAIPLIIIGLATHAQGEQLNLKGVDINVLIETVSRITGRNFVVDPRIKGTATVVTGRDMSDEELYETFLSVLQVHGFAVVETGNITKIIPNNIAKQQTHPIIENTKNQSSEKLVTRLVQIEHVSALSIVSALRPIARGIQIQHHAESNSVIMSGRVDDLRKLETIIIRMDRADEKQIEVIALQYADAKKVVQTIKALDKTGSKGKLSTKNKVSADERTNSLLVTGDKATRTRIRRIVEKIDIPKQKEGNTKVIYLRYAKATDLATVLQGISKTSQVANKDGKAKSAQNPGASTGGSSNIDIQADESSNSLIITADPDVLKNLEVVIAKLDIRRAQVMIETIVAEVSTNLSSALGIQFGFNGLAGNSAGPVGLTNFASAGASNILSVGAAIASGGASAAPGALLGLGGEAGGMQFVALLNALSSDAATNILSTPTLVTMDNEEATIVVGQNIPLLTGSFSSTGNSGGASASNPFTTIERQDIGLTLKVTPQINEGTSVKLAIEQETSSLAASNAGAADLITNKRSITTNVMVEDGEVLVLGGLIENTFRDTQEKIPILGDLPIIGSLFRHDKTAKERQNLMVFIHPVIMRTPETASAYTKQKYSAMQQRQKGSQVLGRGTFNHRANRLPDLQTIITQDPSNPPRTNTIQELPAASTPRYRPAPIAPTTSTAVPYLDDMVD